VSVFSFYRAAESVAIIYGLLPRVQLDVSFGTVIVGHDNGSCSYRALVVGTCSVFDYQVVWGIYNCCMFWYFTHLGW